MSTFDSSGRGNLIRKILILLTVAGVVAAAFAWTPIAKTGQQPSGSADAASLLEGYRHVEVASVSDALEQLSGRDSAHPNDFISAGRSGGDAER